MPKFKVDPLSLRFKSENTDGKITLTKHSPSKVEGAHINSIPKAASPRKVEPRYEPNNELLLSPRGETYTNALENTVTTVYQSHSLASAARTGSQGHDVSRTKKRARKRIEADDIGQPSTSIAHTGLQQGGDEVSRTKKRTRNRMRMEVLLPTLTEVRRDRKRAKTEDNFDEKAVVDVRAASPNEHASPLNEVPQHREVIELSDDSDVEMQPEPEIGRGDIPFASLRDRLATAQCVAYTVEGITAPQLTATVTRRLMSQLYGGNEQRMFPMIAPGRVKDGIQNLGFINLDCNPYAPRRPGDAGLFFVLNPLWAVAITKRLFIQLGTARWLYLGLYDFIPAQPLTVAEFHQLSYKSRSTWASSILSRKWARPFVARIYLRAENEGAEPSMQEVMAICANTQAFKTVKSLVTVQQILQAFTSGQERLCVSCLKCVEYDIEWKKHLIRQSALYVPKAKAIVNAPGQEVAARPRRHRQPRVQDPAAMDIERGVQDRVRASARRRLQAAGLGSDVSDMSDPAESEEEMGSDEEVEALLRPMTMHV
ncbi:hypothetical protein BDW22DRAFT_1364250 [Trametopsis cervina]|nr:hypothetical protein BDW22DRAFT_1364250 [Trametopsis cervina]